MKARPLQIPGRSIRPPDRSSRFRCPSCGRIILFPKLKINPRTKKITLVCPYCERRL